MQTSEQIDQLATALAKAQGEFGPIKRDKTVTVTMRTGGRYTFSYAPLESILHAVMPALNKNGISLSQAVLQDGEREFVETTLLHASGQSRSNRTRIHVKEDGPQAYGSALTYGRRYGVTLILGISADDDDDANAAEGNQAEVRGPTQDAIRALAKKFQDAHTADIDGRMLEVHEEANRDQELYQAAWALLASDVRARIKIGIERARALKDGKEYVPPQPRGSNASVKRS
jgi:hypothetical protein